MQIRDGRVVKLDHPFTRRPTSVYRDKHGIIWMGTLGLGILKLANDGIHPIDTPGKTIGAITQDDAGRLWAVNAGLALARRYTMDQSREPRWSRSGRISHYRMHGKCVVRFSRGCVSLKAGSRGPFNDLSFKSSWIPDRRRHGTCLGADADKFMGATQHWQFSMGRVLLPCFQ